MDAIVAPTVPRTVSECELARVVGEQILKFRKRRGLTLKELADRVGTTPQSMQRMEKVQMTISLYWLEKIAEGLDVRASALLGDDSIAESLEAAMKAEMHMAAMRGALAELCKVVDAAFGDMDAVSAETAA